MKAKSTIPKKGKRLESRKVEPSEQPMAQTYEQANPLPAPSNEERKDKLLPWQKEIIALAEARLSVTAEEDLLPHMHRRAIALCTIVEDMALSTSESETSLGALAVVMEIVQEEIRVAKWLVSGRPLDPRWD